VGPSARALERPEAAGSSLAAARLQVRTFTAFLVARSIAPPRSGEYDDRADVGVPGAASQGGTRMAETNEVSFSGSPNTMIALALVASALALALSVWSISRVQAIEAFVAVQAASAK
jgi:hypothetical protein